MNEDTTQQRQQAILTEIIHYYLTRREAISARTLSKISALHLSPTTIRNLMEDLSLEGFLTSEGVSRGRIPTQKAFTIYVTHLRELPPQPRHAVPAVRLEPGEGFPTLQETLERAGRFLADQTGYVALAALPGKDRYPLHWVRLVRVADDRVLVAVQSMFGDLWSKVIRAAEPLPPDVLRAVERHICTHHHGAPMERIREEIMSGGPMGLLREAPSMGAAFRVLRQAFDWEDAPGWQVWGTEHLYRIPEYMAPDTLLRVHRALDNPALLRTALRRARAVEGGWVAIGTETGTRGLEDSAVVAFPFASGDWRATIGLLGPMRMDYPVVVQLVAQAAAVLESAMEQIRAHAQAPCP